MIKSIFKKKNFLPERLLVKTMLEIIKFFKKKIELRYILKRNISEIKTRKIIKNYFQ